MNDTETVTDDAIEMKVMPLHPFENRPTCEKCGLHINIADMIRYSGTSSAKWTYCEGSLDSTIEISGLFQKPRDVKVPCFGVFVEHLHLTCNRCNWSWLMATKGNKP